MIKIPASGLIAIVMGLKNILRKILFSRRAQTKQRFWKCTSKKNNLMYLFCFFLLNIFVQKAFKQWLMNKLNQAQPRKTCQTRPNLGSFWKRLLFFLQEVDSVFIPTMQLCKLWLLASFYSAKSFFIGLKNIRVQSGCEVATFGNTVLWLSTWAATIMKP